MAARAGLEAGFDTAGVAPVDAAESVRSDQLDAERFAAWVAAGRAGEMDYLKAPRRTGRPPPKRRAGGDALGAVRHRLRPQLQRPRPALDRHRAARHRLDRPLRLERASAAGTEQQRSPEPDELVPTDYHDQLLAPPASGRAALQQRFACETRCYVDTGPLVERAIAAKAGIGWIGKNTCVINQELGSWLLLGVIVTSHPRAPGAPLQIAADRCGTCTRCIDACPTDALVAPHQMDASRCIAYLTIEKKGTIPEELREPMGRQVFGCDICQDVCPWNRKAPVPPSSDAESLSREDARPPA